MKQCLQNLLSPLAALCLGITLTFAFAPFEIFPLAVVAPAGLLALILHASPKRAFWLGFAFGFGLFAAGIYWIYISVHFFGDVSPYLAVLALLLVAAYLALYSASVCYLTNRYFPAANKAKLIYAFPAIWVFVEWIRSWLFTGFPWLFLGYSQTNSPLKGYAPLLSVYGVSLAVALTSGLLVNAVLKYKQKEYRSLYLNLLAISIIWIAGGLLSLIPWTKPHGQPLQISLVQGNIPQSIKWSPEHLQLSFDRYTELTEPLWGKDKFIVWPEAAIPLSLQNAESFIEKMDAKARATGSHLILGIPIKSSSSDGYYNAVITLGDDKQTYTKRLLVPFGEYVPMQKIFSKVFAYLNIPMSISETGKYVQAPLHVGGAKILTSICFEIAFPELINSHDSSVGLLLTVTNDAWFGNSTERAQHLQMAQMRAIEMGRPVLVSSNDGITAIIGPRGNIEAVAPTQKEFVLNSQVQPTNGLTPWMKNGIDPMLLILSCLLITGIRYNRRIAKIAYKLKTIRDDNGRTI